MRNASRNQWHVYRLRHAGETGIQASCATVLSAFVAGIRNVALRIGGAALRAEVERTVGQTGSPISTAESHEERRPGSVQIQSPRLFLSHRFFVALLGVLPGSIAKLSFRRL